MDLRQWVQAQFIVHGTISNDHVQLVTYKKEKGTFFCLMYHSCVSLTYHSQVHQYGLSIFSNMRSSQDIHVLNISYDIACQWNKHLWSHMSAFPHQYHINHNHKVATFLIPKFHLPVAKQNSHSTSSRVSGGLMAKPQSTGGQISTPSLQVLVRWDPDPGKTPSMITSTIGIGRRFVAWVNFHSINNNSTLTWSYSHRHNSPP